MRTEGVWPIAACSVCGAPVSSRSVTERGTRASAGGDAPTDWIAGAVKPASAEVANTGNTAKSSADAPPALADKTARRLTPRRDMARCLRVAPRRAHNALLARRFRTVIALQFSPRLQIARPLPERGAGSAFVQELASRRRSRSQKFKGERSDQVPSRQSQCRVASA